VYPSLRATGIERSHALLVLRGLCFKALFCQAGGWFIIKLDK
jgi:hypothetical protein